MAKKASLQQKAFGMVVIIGGATKGASGFYIGADGRVHKIPSNNPLAKESIRNLVSLIKAR